MILVLHFFGSIFFRRDFLRLDKLLFNSYKQITFKTTEKKLSIFIFITRQTCGHEFRLSIHAAPEERDGYLMVHRRNKGLFWNE